MKKTYQWKQLSEDGLLRDPEGYGHYKDSTPNGYKGFFNEKGNALIYLENFFCDHEDAKGNKYVLLTIYEDDR